MLFHVPETMQTAQIQTVVIADDHEVTRFGLTHLLKAEMGVRRVIAVGDFDAALACLDDADPELMIVDLGMPGLDGPEALSQVRTLRPRVKIAVLSASSDREDILGCLAAGAHGYIVKTQVVASLTECLRQILDGAIYAPPGLAELNSMERAEPHEPKDAPDAYDRLTARQQKVLHCLERGLSNKEIARELSISERTVKMHLSMVYRVLGARNRTQAVMIASTGGGEGI